MDGEKHTYHIIQYGLIIDMGLVDSYEDMLRRIPIKRDLKIYFDGERVLE